jgi:hypothetical protein
MFKFQDITIILVVYFSFTPKLAQNNSGIFNSMSYASYLALRINNFFIFVLAS